MFKVICDFQNIGLPANIGPMLKAVQHQNCQACYFNSYTIFGKAFDSTKRINAAKAAIKKLESTISIHVTPKIKFIQDFTNFKFIALFDENSNYSIQNDQYGDSILYHAIIRNIEVTPTNIWEYINSYFTSPGQNDGENFSILIENLYPLEFKADDIKKVQPGILEFYSDKEDATFTSSKLDKYFLKFLFHNHEITKCIPLLDESFLLSNYDDNPTNTQQSIYNAYQEILPKLVTESFFHHFVNNRRCVKKDTDITLLLGIESQKYILTSKTNFETFSSNFMLMMCENMGGRFYTIKSRIENGIEACRTVIEEAGSDIDLVFQDYGPDNEIYEVSFGNSLFKLTCSNLETTLATNPDLMETYLY